MQALLGFAVFVGPNNQAPARRDFGAFREPPFARNFFAVSQEFARQIDLTVGGVRDLDVVVVVALRILASSLVFRNDLVYCQHGLSGLGSLDAEGQRLGFGMGWIKI